MISEQRHVFSSPCTTSTRLIGRPNARARQAQTNAYNGFLANIHLTGYFQKDALQDYIRHLQKLSGSSSSHTFHYRTPTRFSRMVSCLNIFSLFFFINIKLMKSYVSSCLIMTALEYFYGTRTIAQARICE